MVLVQTWRFFQIFFLGNISQENIFYDILELKNAFLGYKKIEVQKVKILRFFQGGYPMVLVQKWPFSQLFFFMQYRSVKCLLQYFRAKKRLSVL